MTNLPSGTVTFLFTDIEGCTKLAQQYPNDMPAILARHNQILNQTIEAHNGLIFRVIGDSHSASFHNANDALLAALEAQKNLHNKSGSPAPIKVRMGIHTGAAQLEINSKENTYSGYATLALTQRIMSADYGGQILLSQSTYELTRDRLPENVQLVDMGEQRLKDIFRQKGIYQLSKLGLPSEFPPLKTLESFPHNLPAQLTSFTRREREIHEASKLLANTFMLTFIGPGGTGKTRLSLQVAEAQLTDFKDGIWFIELAQLTDSAYIISRAASVFNLREVQGVPDITIAIDYLCALRPPTLTIFMNTPPTLSLIIMFLGNIIKTSMKPAKT